jgi:hypothetical protein
MCSACGRILSSAKRWNVSRTSSKSSPKWRGPSVVGQTRQYRRVALRRDEVGHRRIPAGLDAPESFATGDGTADEIGHDVGDEGGGNAGLDVTECAVLQRGPAVATAAAAWATS